MSKAMATLRCPVPARREVPMRASAWKRSIPDRPVSQSTVLSGATRATKTSNMGSLYKLTYNVKLKNRNQTKELIDELRCRNGNLEISIFESAEEVESL
jgi:hypothetical protein